jgi:hypothetical protein
MVEVPAVKGLKVEVVRVMAVRSQKILVQAVKGLKVEVVRVMAVRPVHNRDQSSVSD